MTEKCPICKEEMDEFEDRDIVVHESEVSCKKGHYYRYYSYGVSTVFVGTQEFSWNYMIDEKDLLQIQLKIGEEIEHFKVDNGYA